MAAPAATINNPYIRVSHPRGRTGVVKALLKAGADVNESSPEYGAPLLMAASSGHEALSLLLLEKGANANASDLNSITPLHYAVRKGLV